MSSSKTFSLILKRVYMEKILTSVLLQDILRTFSRTQNQFDFVLQVVTVIQIYISINGYPHWEYSVYSALQESITVLCVWESTWKTGKTTFLGFYK